MKKYFSLGRAHWFTEMYLWRAHKIPLGGWKLSTIWNLYGERTGTCSAAITPLAKGSFLLKADPEIFRTLSQSAGMECYPYNGAGKQSGITFRKTSSSPSLFETHIMVTSPKRMYELYYHHFPHYMLTSRESTLLHFLLLSFACFVGYGVYSYLPSTIMFSVSRAYYYIFGLESLNTYTYPH